MLLTNLFLYGYDGIFNFLGILGTVVIQDTILKKYSSTVATIFTGFASAALFGHTLTINYMLGISIVFISMYQFFSPLSDVKEEENGVLELEFVKKLTGLYVCLILSLLLYMYNFFYLIFMNVYRLEDSNFIDVTACANEEVNTVKHRIQTCNGFVVKKQKLVFGGRELSRNNSLVRDYVVCSGDVLHLIIGVSDLLVITVETAVGEEFEFRC
ncbi:putative Ubiquitin domain-containing protein [Helianthus annuus]|nr:putative Ubiquitin domain-containing protein [Helianthus annuus]